MDVYIILHHSVQYSDYLDSGRLLCQLYLLILFPIFKIKCTNFLFVIIDFAITKYV